jgi:hypothetical protein
VGKRYLGVVLAAAVAMAGCTSANPARSNQHVQRASDGVIPRSRSPQSEVSTAMRQPPPTAAHRSRPPLSVHILLRETTVPAGTPIKGVAIVRNATGHRLVIVDCNGTWLQVGLTSATVRYLFTWAHCLTFTTVPAGTTHVPIRVATTYGGCARMAVGDLPACLRTTHGPPPLPPGRYVTKVVTLAPKGVRIPAPPPIRVKVTP